MHGLVTIYTDGWGGWVGEKGYGYFRVTGRRRGSLEAYFRRKIVKLISVIRTDYKIKIDSMKDTLLETLIISQTVKKINAFYEIQRLISVNKRSLTLSQANLVCNHSSQFNKVHFLLSFHIFLGIPSDLFSST
jgi:hypothetical protein